MRIFAGPRKPNFHSQFAYSFHFWAKFFLSTSPSARCSVAACLYYRYRFCLLLFLRLARIYAWSCVQYGRDCCHRRFIVRIFFWHIWMCEHERTKHGDVNCSIDGFLRRDEYFYVKIQLADKAFNWAVDRQLIDSIDRRRKQSIHQIQ